MSESNIDIRIIFAEAAQRDGLANFLNACEQGDSPEATSLEERGQELRAVGISPDVIIDNDGAVSFSAVRPHGDAGLDFHLFGGVHDAPAQADKLIRAVMPLKPREIIYADLNDQVMEFGLYYFDGRQSCSYETGMDGPADEAIWEADANDTLLDTVGDLARAGALVMPEPELD